MTEWQVFVVIGVVVGFIVTVTTPIIKLTKAITILSENIKTLDERFSQSEAAQEKSKGYIWERLNEHSVQISENSKEIAVLKRCPNRKEG